MHNLSNLELILIISSLIISLLFLVVSVLNHKNALCKLQNIRVFTDYLSENSIASLTQKNQAENIYKLIEDKCLVNGKYYLLYKWLIEYWDIYYNKYPEQIGLFRNKLMESINYENLDIENDQYMKPVIAILNYKFNQLPAILINDLLNQKHTKYLGDTFNFRKLVVEHLDMIDLEQENYVLVTYPLKGQVLNKLVREYKITKDEALGKRISEKAYYYLVNVKSPQEMDFLNKSEKQINKVKI